MKTTLVLALLTVVNLALLAYQIAGARPVQAAPEPDILRGRGLEIVDDEGRMRFQLTIAPGDSEFKMPDGTIGYPETVILRLITADGKPRVKLTTSTDGSGLLLLGDSDTSYTLLKSDRGNSSVRVLNGDGSDRVLKP